MRDIAICYRSRHATGTRRSGVLVISAARAHASNAAHVEHETARRSPDCWGRRRVRCRRTQDLNVKKPHVRAMHYCVFIGMKSRATPATIAPTLAH